MTDFEKQIYIYLKKVPKSKVTTYSALARAIGKPAATRAVGNALNKNPNAPKVPCHRVVKADGYIGGYAKGKQAKLRLLKKEGIIVKKDKISDFKKVLFKF